jgi:hypothetical protein
VVSLSSSFPRKHRDKGTPDPALYSSGAVGATQRGFQLLPGRKSFWKAHLDGRTEHSCGRTSWRRRKKVVRDERGEEDMTCLFYQVVGSVTKCPGNAQRMVRPKQLGRGPPGEDQKHTGFFSKFPDVCPPGLH